MKSPVFWNCLERWKFQLRGRRELVLQGVYSPVDVRVGGGVVQVHTNGALHVRLVEVRRQVGWGCRVIRWVTDVVGATAAEAMKVSVVNIPCGNLKEDTYE